MAPATSTGSKSPAPAPSTAVGAYVFAYVEVDLPAGAPEGTGPRIITNIVGCDPESVRIGDRVQAVFHDTASGHALIRFEPASG